MRTLLAQGFHKPRMGSDAGDRPPITPMRAATEEMLGNDTWRLYQYICQHFIGTDSLDCKYTRLDSFFLNNAEYTDYSYFQSVKCLSDPPISHEIFKVYLLFPSTFVPRS